ncbi:MAG: cytochrome c oxidase subunit 3 [Catalinimonas sp.]
MPSEFPRRRDPPVTRTFMRSRLYARRDPYLMMLWLGIFGSVLIFLFLSGLYLLRGTQTGWERFDLPRVFWFSTIAIVASSFTLSAARRAFHQEQFVAYRVLITCTFLLAVFFTVGQVVGWRDLYAQGIQPATNMGGAFVFLFSGLHVLHLAGGMLVLVYALVDGWRYRRYVDSFIQTINPVKVARLRLVTLYWHFVDILWLYLFGFLLYHHV